MATCSTFLSLDLLFDPSTVSSCYHYLSSSLPIFGTPLQRALSTMLTLISILHQHF